jgi:germination protein YpeB
MMFKKRSLLAIFVSILVAGTSTFGTLMYLDRRDYRNYLQNQYERNLYDLTSDVENLQVALSKVEVAGSPKRSLLLFGEIWKEAGTAQYRLNTLPISHVAISQTSKFLSQVGDFSFSLLKAINSGASISQTEMNNVSKLRDYAGYLSKQLHLLESDVAAKKVSLEAMKYSGGQLFSRQAENPMDVKFQSISQEIQQEYPTLIYDGPFAENVLNIKPRILSSPMVSQERAKEIAANVIGKDKIDSIGIYSDKKGETIPAYSFSVKMKGRKDSDVNIDISKNGGMVVYMLDARNVGQPKLSVSDASKIGVKFLEKNGYRDMIPTFSMRYDETAVINFVSVRNKVVIYPDQIKLKIALDNGNIIGIEAMHYLTAHYDRKIPSPRINTNEARKNVSRKISIKNIRLTIIPMESMREVLCYEFYGTYNNERYMVYINAIDGTEERILKIMDTENGELSM